MKKLIYIFAILIICFSQIFLNSCMKDKLPPKIFPIGGDTTMNNKNGNALTVLLQTLFVDPGATADDNFDGSDITKKIVATHNIPLDRFGKTTTANDNTTPNYTITYTVTDSKGNKATKTRKVYVVNGMRRYAVDYLVDRNDDNPLQDAISFPEYTNLLDTLAVDARNNNRIIFPRLSRGIADPLNSANPTQNPRTSFSGSLRIYGDITNKTKITIPTQTIIKADLLPPNEKWAYQVVGDPNLSVIDSAYNSIKDNYRITLRYTIYKLKKLDSLSSPTWRVYQDTTTSPPVWYGGISSNQPGYYKFAKCTEVYKRQ